MSGVRPAARSRQSAISNQRLAISYQRSVFRLQQSLLNSQRKAIGIEQTGGGFRRAAAPLGDAPKCGSHAPRLRVRPSQFVGCASLVARRFPKMWVARHGIPHALGRSRDERDPGLPPSPASSFALQAEGVNRSTSHLTRDVGPGPRAARPALALARRTRSSPSIALLRRFRGGRGEGVSAASAILACSLRLHRPSHCRRRVSTDRLRP
jgi:hypothetical protein